MKSKNACGSRERERESRNLRKIEEREGLYSLNRPLFICTTKLTQGISVNSFSGITLIALVVTIVVLLILASVSITVVFGDNGILQLAKEAGDKTNEAIQKDLQDIQNLEDTIGDIVNNGWSVSKVTAVTSADGKVVPVPKGFVGSKADGENTVSGGFVIYEGDIPVTNANVADARKERNQFVWVPADGVSLRYGQGEETWSYSTPDYVKCKDHWTDVESEEEQAIVKREESVAKYGGFYVGRYEAGIENSNTYKNNDTYQGNATNRNNTNGIPVTKKGRQAWNNVNQTNAKKLSENMYKTSTSVTSRLIDSYAWDTICTWLSNNEINVTNSTSWGNYLDASFKIKGLYAYHQYYRENEVAYWIEAPTYSRTNDEEPIKELEAGRTQTNTKEKPRQAYEIETGATVVDENGNEIDRNKAKNIYDFAGNMWEWTTETHDPMHYKSDSCTKTDGATYAVIRGGGFVGYGGSNPASKRNIDFTDDHCEVDFGFRPVIYIK